MIAALKLAIANGDAEGVQSAVHELTYAAVGQDFVDDDVAFEVIAILRRPEMLSSPLSPHVLNFFEFASSKLSQRAKDRCLAFLREWGHQFTHVYSIHVVSELQHGKYLLPAPPKRVRKKPRHNDA